MNNSSKVYYLKYRPQSLDELIGQENIIQSLRGALNSGRESHAYLFVGPRGVGKTSTARIFAKMVNCELRTGTAAAQFKVEDLPCNKCPACLSISDGSSLDLMEIDAASNRSIDDVRELREKIKLSPSLLSKKVYIIDEVHMLTTEAFNALLKTLEEPPAHVLFILATTEAHKIPATIISRVTRIDFKAGTGESLVKALRKVVDGEKLKVEDEALSLIAKRADGSYRDGVKILDQLSSLDKITLKDVEELYKGGSGEICLKILESFAEKDTKKALWFIADEVAHGSNLKELLVSIMDLLREVLLIKHGVDSGQGSDLVKLSDEFTTEELIADLEHFQKAYEALKFTAILSLPLEIAVVESCQKTGKVEKVVIPSEEIIQKTDVILEGAQRPRESEHKDPIAKTLSSLQDDNLNVDQAGMTKDVVIDDSGDMAKLKDRWNYIVETITLDNFSLGALLRGIKLGGVEDNRVLIKVPYSFHQRILETPRNRDLLESVLADVLGKEARIKVMLDQRPIRVEELQNVELAADDEVIRIAAEIFSSES